MNYKPYYEFQLIVFPWKLLWFHPTKVAEESEPDNTICQCNHLTTFGAGIKIPINKINLKESAFTKLDENPVAFTFMLCCLCLYFLVIIWARKADQRDIVKVRLINLRWLIWLISYIDFNENLIILIYGWNFSIFYECLRYNSLTWKNVLKRISVSVILVVQRELRLSFFVEPFQS